MSETFTFTMLIITIIVAYRLHVVMIHVLLVCDTFNNSPFAARGHVYQYSTAHYLDRTQRSDGVWGTLVRSCIPCCVRTERFTEDKVESSPGAAIELSQYLTDVEHQTFNNNWLDSTRRSSVWKCMSSGLLVYMSLLGCFLCGVLPLLVADMEDENGLGAAAIVACFLGLYSVIVRLIQSLTRYWRERELRHNTEVCAWGDGTLTRGRPLSMFVCMIVYVSIQGIVLVGVLTSTVLLVHYGHSKWSVLTITLPVIMFSEVPSSMLHLALDQWIAGVNEDHLTLALLETTDLLDQAWFKIRDFDTQNRIYTFREALIRHFRLDTLRMTYMKS